MLVTAAVVLASAARADAAPDEGIHKIQHVVMIMQENRSFDSYFGTYPGANDIPASACVPDPGNGGCVKPFHNENEKGTGGPHGAEAAVADIDGGKMDGFIKEAEARFGCEEAGGCGCPKGVEECAQDAVGYYDARDIPNYWTYAENYALQDNMFESAASYSLPEHLFLVSGWSAICPNGDENPMECVDSLEPIKPARGWGQPIEPGHATYAWTDITYLMARAGVTWRYYVTEGNEPDCENDEEESCEKVRQLASTPGIWNPLADFTDVKQDGQLGNIKPLPSYYEAVHQQPTCGLPNVSWVVPNQLYSEHPPADLRRGQAYVTTLINSIMRSPCWGSTAIFLSWDDWGGFYDHVVPPNIDENGYGLRVPGLVISPYSRAGFIDHQRLSHDAYLKFIEDDFLSGERLNPLTDGRPDPRPDVREQAPGLGNLLGDFNFEQAPRAPMLLPPMSEDGSASAAPGEPQTPALETAAASTVTQSSATLNGTVNPDGGMIGSCRFEYGTTSSYGSTVPCSSLPGAGTKAIEVSAQVGGLTRDTTYHFRIVASNPAGTSYGPDLTLITINLPSVTQVNPGAGDESGGDTMTIMGSALSEATAVKFGPASAPHFTVNSPSSMTVVSPPGAGLVNVTVTTPLGTSHLNRGDVFHYAPPPTITAISPKNGTVNGGRNVVITGTNLNEATAVHFGASAASSLEGDAETSLTATTPAEPAGSVEVTVTTPGGTTAATPADRYRFIAP